MNVGTRWLVGIAGAVVARPHWRSRSRWFGATVIGVGLAVWYLVYVPIPDYIALSKKGAVDLAELPALIQERRVVMVGEWHGLVEPVETVKRLLSETPAEHPFTHLAMEMPISWQPDIDQYFSGDDKALEPLRRFMAKFPSGTVESAAVFSFVREWNRAHPERSITVRFIDVKSPIQGTLEEDRDQHMFEQIEGIVATSDKSRVLVHVGATHATRTGEFHYRSKEGRCVAVPVLGAMLHERYAGQVISVWVLRRDESVWQALNQDKTFAGPVAIRLTPQWTRPLGFYTKSPVWFPNPQEPLRSADQLFNYAIWWPTSRRGTKLQ